ncbi:MAG: serine/threonine protein kinase [Oscillospiraceae bacterium]|nr:serine/threonine protein kinase [Oscillospiraceae bacterium]
MIRINGRTVCENCFEKTESSKCPCCGYDAENSADDPTMLAPGSILFKKYIVGGTIGKGGFGITYLAYDTKTNKKVAVKEYFPYSIARRSAGSAVVSVASESNKETFELGAEKFYEEAQLVSKFNGNPNIVEVYEFFYENDTVYLAMEYLQGCTLKEYIRDNGVISAAQALYIANGVSNALAEAHGASVLHRDISPDNIVLCSSGDVKLIDFGAARQVIAEYSQSFSVILKHGFAPLEQYNSKGNQGPWTDIYSLGATLYFALTGDIPEDPMIRFDNDDTFKENRFGIEPGLWTVISKATDMKAENRYRDAHEMQADLNKIGLKPEPIVISAKKSAEQKLAKNTVSQSYRQNISFSAEQNTKSFFGRHKSVIIAACALAAVSAAVIVPVSLNRGGTNNAIDAYAPGADSSDTSESMESTEASSSQPDEDDGSDKGYVPQYVASSINDYKSKVLYNTLDDEEKELFDIIYSGIEKTDININVPDLKYTGEHTDKIYNKLLFDNPQLCYANTIEYTYNDINKNMICDPDEYIFKISPRYIDSDNSVTEYQLFVNLISSYDPEVSQADNLALIHDKMSSLVKRIAEREPNEAYSTAYYFLNNLFADDIACAQTFCYAAQALDFPSYVVSGTFNGEPRAWCRIKLDGTWYNVDFYADMTIKSAVTELEVDNGKRRRFRTFFLVNDDFIRKYGYVPDEDYAFIFDEEYAANSPESNYYLQRDGQNAFYIDPDGAYDFLLEESAKNYNEETDKTSCYVMPLEAEGLYKRLDGQFLSDLEEKYGITPSEFEIKYYPDEFVIVMS